MKLAKGCITSRAEMRLMLFALITAAVGAAPPVVRDQINNVDCNITLWDMYKSVAGVCLCTTSAECSACDRSTHTMLLATGSQETVVLPELIASFPHLNNVNITGATVVFEHNNTFQLTLKNLNVFCGSVSTLRSKALSWASHLMTLRIVHCGLQDLYPESLTGLGSLKDLDLSDNNITEIPAGLLMPLNSIYRVVLDNNSIQALPEKVFSMRDDCEISLNSNNISYIARGAFLDRRVKRLWLARNQLRDLSMLNNALLEVDAHEISLEGNLLESVPHGVRFMVNLQKLDLRWNKIASLQSDDLTFMGNNLVLDLRNNLITEVTLPEVDHLSQLWLDKNPLRCDGRLLPLFKRLCKSGESAPSQCGEPQALQGRVLCQLSPRDFLDTARCGPCLCSRRPAVNETEVVCAEPPGALPAEATRAGERVTLRLSRPPPRDETLVVPPGVTGLSLVDLNLTVLPPLPEVNVSLAGNPLDCSCQQLKQLRELGSRVLDAKAVRCASTRLPYEEVARRCERAADGHELVWAAAAALAVAALAATLAATRRPHVWRAVLGRRAPRGPATPPASQYEVFLSSASEDARWVSREVLPELERELGARLCVGARAYLPGVLVGAQAAKLAAEARVTLALVTPQYLASGAARLELAAGGARGGLVAVLVGVERAEVPLPADARTLRWGAPLFWRRLWALVPASPPERPLPATNPVIFKNVILIK